MLLRSFTKPLALLGTGSLLYLGLRNNHANAAAAGLSSDQFREFELLKVKQYNHNTKLYSIKVPGVNELPVASFVLTKGPLGSDGKDVIRPYTPIESKTLGTVDLLIKTYPNGPMSSHLNKLNPGAKIELKGPIPKIAYKPNMKKEIGMIAGGTGITPMLQVMRKIASDPSDKTKVSLIFCNLTEDDILLKEVLDELTAKNKQFSVTYAVDNPKRADWKGEKGLITEALIKNKMPKPAEDTMVFVCGPPGFMSAVSGQKAKDYSQGDLAGYLLKLGYKPENVFKF
jgi:cytochrome-b5 reductase